MRVPSGLLFKIHEPIVRISCWAEGRPASREEVEHSLITGLPALEKLAREDDEFNQDTGARARSWAAESSEARCCSSNPRRGRRRMDKRLIDPDCVELAEHFLATVIPAGKKRPDDAVKLAEAIQLLCEDYCKEVEERPPELRPEIHMNG